MLFESLSLPGLTLITTKRYEDNRGFFCESFRADQFEAQIGTWRFVQDNHSKSEKRGTLRGMHFQRRPREQGKLVRVVRGAVLDVAADVRRGSPTYGKHVTVELNDANDRQLWIPPGFLHGFCTLSDETEVIYKVTDYYSPAHDACVAWNDPDLAIDWPVSPREAILSDRDAQAARLRDTELEFTF